MTLNTTLQCRRNLRDARRTVSFLPAFQGLGDTPLARARSPLSLERSRYPRLIQSRWLYLEDQNFLGPKVDFFAVSRSFNEKHLQIRPHLYRLSRQEVGPPPIPARILFAFFYWIAVRSSDLYSRDVSHTEDSRGLFRAQPECLGLPHESTRWNREVLLVDHQSVTVKDIIHAAHFRGELEPCWRDLLDRVRRDAPADESADDLNATDTAALQSLSEEFRYQRDLITAEETEHWLEERALTLEDFNDYFLRQYAKTASGGKFDPAHLDRSPAFPVDFSAAPDGFPDLLVAELWFSGEMDRWAAELSWRFAARPAEGEITSDALTAERARFCQRAGLEETALPAWLARVDRDPPWLDAMLQLEAAFHRQCAAVLTGEELARTLRSLRMPLTRLVVETMELESRAAAREALLCVREDGQSMEEVARQAAYPYWRTEMALEDFPEEWQSAAIGAAPGEILELECGERFQLCRLIQKSEPSLADPVVRDRLERVVLDRHFSGLSARTVKWIIPPSIAS